MFFFLLELIFAAQVPSAKSTKLEPHKIKVLHSMYIFKDVLCHAYFGFESQAPVFRRLDNAIHWINHCSYLLISVNKRNHAIHWIVIYLVDSIIQLSNNLGWCVKSWCQLFEIFDSFSLVCFDYFGFQLMEFLSSLCFACCFNCHVYFLKLYFSYQR